jgi:hypothetical protein
MVSPYLRTRRPGRGRAARVTRVKESLIAVSSLFNLSESAIVRWWMTHGHGHSSSAHHSVGPDQYTGKLTIVLKYK